MNTQICNKMKVSVLLAAFALSSLVSPVKADDNFKFYHNGIPVPGSGECFADQANGDFLSAESCFYHNDNNLVKADYVVIGKEKKVKDSNTQTEINTEISVVTVVPKILEIVPETPKEKDCKNKNSGKDGTPEECNAGIGQEKKN